MTYQPRYLNLVDFTFVDRGGGIPIWWISGANRDPRHPLWDSAILMSNPKFYGPWFVRHICMEWADVVRALVTSEPAQWTLRECVLDEIEDAYNEAETAIYEADPTLLRQSLDMMIVGAHQIINCYIDGLRDSYALNAIVVKNEQHPFVTAAYEINQNYLDALR